MGEAARSILSFREHFRRPYSAVRSSIGSTQAMLSAPLQTNRSLAMEDDIFAVRNFLPENPEGDALVCLGSGLPPSESVSASGELFWIIDDAYDSGEEKSNEIFLETYDPTEGVSSGRFGSVDEQFFIGLSDLLKASGLDLFANNQYFPDSFGESDLDPSPACFHFRITYQDVHSICGYSDVPEDREIFAEIAQTVISFCEPSLTESRT